ncbi:hypothetical protein GE09DRAFT_1164819 [Coniochaeta sp. 2T2.1]|nr:hypothetical protein GE09DRAFT_1164819 [Coniochaeta sp. 2T2.1]
MTILLAYGPGLHVWTLQPAEVKEYTRTFFVSVILYRTSLVAIKICFLLHYLRIFPLENIRKACFVLLATVVVWGSLQLPLLIFQCRPISAFWDKTIESTCFPMAPQWYTHAVGNIAIDIAILILPLPVLKTLTLPMAEKICLLGIFSLGFL